MAEYTVDLSRFTSLTKLRLDFSFWNLHKHLQTLALILSTISSTQLEHLRIDFNNADSFSLDSLLAILSHLAAIDDTLARPQFAHLSHVTFHYGPLHIYEQALPVLFADSPPASENTVALISDSSTQAIPSSTLVSTRPQVQVFDEDDPNHPFRLYAESIVRDAICNGMRKACIRRIMNIQNLRVRLASPE